MMKTKSHLLLTVLISFLLITQNAHADFRKALDAYIARDGDTMLKEVKDAVDKKNDDSLLLFLNALSLDEIVSSNKYKVSAQKKSEKFDVKNNSRFGTILTKTQQQELVELINVAASNSTVESQYKFYSMRNFNINFQPTLNNWRSYGEYSTLSKQEQEKYIEATTDFEKVRLTLLESIANKGSADAALELFLHYDAKNVVPPQFSREKALNWLIKSAELGNPVAASILGYKYLHIQSDILLSHSGCDDTNTENVCLVKDEERGEYWLQQAAKGFDENPTYFGMRTLAYDIGRYLESRYKGNEAQLMQAHLWYQLALNSPLGYRLGVVTYDEKKIREALGHYEISVGNGGLKKSKQFNYLPDWVVNSRIATRKEFPAFSLSRRDYYFKYQLSIYANGNVYLEFPVGMNDNVTKDKSIYMHVSPSRVKEFVEKLGEIGIDQWPVNRGVFDEEMCTQDFHCNAHDYLVRLNTNTARSLFYVGFSDVYSGDDERVKKKLKAIQKIISIVETYFPTQKLRCNLVESKSFEDSCVLIDSHHYNLSNSGIKNDNSK